MTVSSVVNIVIPILAGVAILVALFYTGRAIQRRSEVTQAPYGVGRQRARQAAQVDLVRGVIALLVSLILFGVFGLTPRMTEGDVIVPPADVPAAQPVATTPLASPSATPTATAIATATTLPTPTATMLAETPTATLEPTETPPPRTATVISEVGVWLRDEPGVATQQIEWLLEGTLLTVLDGEASADEFEWQQVQAPSGNIGWVAVPFIAFQEP